MKSIRNYLVWQFVNCNPRFRRLLLRLFVRGGEQDISLFGATLRIDRREEFGYLNAFRYAQRSIVFRDEVAPLVNLALLLQPGDTFVDVGANVGLYSAALARATRFLPGVRFYAFEPHPETAARLRASLWELAVDVCELGVSDHSGEIAFCEGAGSWVFAPAEDRNEFQIPSKTRMIRVARLDSLPIAGGSLVIKIDVENHERQVLEGAEGFFRAGRVKVVYVDGFKDKEIPDWLSARGFNLFEGRTGQPGKPDYSLLAVHKTRIAVTTAQPDLKPSTNSNPLSERPACVHAATASSVTPVTKT